MIRDIPAVNTVEDQKVRMVLEALRESVHLLGGRQGPGFRTERATTVQDLITAGMITLTPVGDIVRSDISIEKLTEEFLTWLDDGEASFRVSNVVTESADFTILSEQNGTAFSNEGSSGIITGTLPVAAVGLEYVFVRNETGNDLRVDPNGTETIRGGGAGKYLELNADGESATLKCFKLLEWEVIASNGTLSFEP